MSTTQNVDRVPPLPPRITVQLVDARPAARRWTRWLWWGVTALLLLLVVQMSASIHDYYDTTGGIQERFHSGSRNAEHKIAVIDVSGLILEGEGFVKKQIDRVRNDDRVVAVVLRVDSPGGTVSGADYLYHHLRKLREERKMPLVVSMGSIAASGGYYVAMAVGDQPQSIFAEPTTLTGSIGVMIPHYDISGLLQRWDIADQSIASHPRKLMLSMTRPMSDEHRQLLQRQVDELFTRFKDVVRSGRPALRHPNNDVLVHEDVDLATGEVFTAEQARRYGLVDSIGFLEDAIARAAALAGTSVDQVRVVRYRRQVNVWDLMWNSWQSQHRTAPWGPWLEGLEWAVPRPYYLWSCWPTTITSPRLAP